MTIPECSACAKCCQCGPYLVRGADEHVPQEFVLPDLPIPNHPRFFGQMRQHESGACAALNEETKTCTIYTLRPGVCRSFERGGMYCLEMLNGN